jgi:fibronectin type 3 domain-containing protein
MKTGNKILITIFISVFILSSTGLPLSLHLCKMMESVSVESCQMCSVRITETCCSSEYEVNFNSGTTSCCDTKIAAEPLEDDYVTVKVNLDNVTDYFVTYISLTELNSDNNYHSDIFYGESPPGKYGHEIYLLNSTFLI